MFRLNRGYNALARPPQKWLILTYGQPFLHASIWLVVFDNVTFYPLLHTKPECLDLVQFSEASPRHNEPFHNEPSAWQTGLGTLDTFEPDLVQVYITSLVQVRYKLMRRVVEQESFYVHFVDVQLMDMPGQWSKPLSPLLTISKVQRYPLRNTGKNAFTS